MASTACYPKTDFDTKAEIVRDDGTRLYRVSVIAPYGKEAETFEVIVPAKSCPISEDTPPMSELSFENLTLSFGKMQSGKKYWALRADSVRVGA